jgi:hypothetical protein
MEDQLPVPTHNKFEFTNPAFDRAKTVHASERAATVIGFESVHLLKILKTIPMGTAKLERIILY